MHLILTHEQADFDAVASQLGAHLLNETAVPVVSRKQNRNVRAFLTFYGADLPFVEARDLPSKPVQAVTLVDTQSLTSVKGMSAETRVHVIDHHPLREDLPPEWEITVSGTGANTTVFVEALRDRDVLLGSVHATLLLLGIYEDTGSLTYSRTTPRDLRAAGYLLEQGASLQIAADFLNHPLSQEQQALYELLRESAQSHTINGHTIVVACGDAQGMDEELSTVAHKLRDVLDPEALFVVIKTRGGVQMIARSTSDDIDVAAVLVQFGGGGHERAAAGLVKDSALDAVYDRLLALLPDYVQPSVRVSQIMSRGPQTLRQDTLVDEAARRMQRYGYEGYPVVDEHNRLVGLLTRRAVDRALSHHLPYSAANLMDAGSFTVQPDDSLEHLQRLMTDSGWGQIPVVDPASGEIIGIVTRTDLLKTLTPRPRVPSRRSLAERLEKALPPGRLAILRIVARLAQEQLTAVYIVGGFVRDLILERPSLDFDIVVEEDAISLAKALARRYGGRVTSHLRFGTAKWLISNGSAFRMERFKEDCPELAGALQRADLPETLDFVTARTEFYTHPTALPTVERGSIKLDLHRRDFTINTLAVRLDGGHYGELQDYWGGLSDLRGGLVRVLHSLSFVDDPTRILRAVRFEQRFGFRIETRTLELLREALSLLDRISGDRIRHELDQVLVEPNVAQILARLAELGVLPAIHTDLGWDTWLEERLHRLLSLDTGALLPDLQQAYNSLERKKLVYLLWMLRLPPGRAGSLMARLKFSAEMRMLVQSACELWRELPELASRKPSAITRRLDDVPLPALVGLYLASDTPQVQDMLITYLAHWRKVMPRTDGHALRARGLAPGPLYKDILRELRDAWLDGEIQTDEQEQQRLERLLAQAAERPGGLKAR